MSGPVADTVTHHVPLLTLSATHIRDTQSVFLFPSFSLTHAHFLVFYELMLEMWFFLKEISQILHQIE